MITLCLSAVIVLMGSALEGKHANRRFRSYPALDRLSPMGMGNRRRRRSSLLFEALRICDGAERAHPSDDAEGRGERYVSYRDVYRLSPTRSGHRSFPGADESARGAVTQCSGD